MDRNDHSKEPALPLAMTNETETRLHVPVPWKLYVTNSSRAAATKGQCSPFFNPHQVITSNAYNENFEVI